MLKHNRRKNLRSNIPVGLPFDVEGAQKYIKDHLGHDTMLEVRVIKNILKQTATDEDLE